MKHPALNTSITNTLVGIATGIVWQAPGSTIFEIQLSDESVRARADFGVLTTIPTSGEVWLLNGDYEQTKKYGVQFVVLSGFRKLPEGNLIVRYLEQHIPGIGIVKARRLWSQFRLELYDLLDNSDVDRLSAKNGGKLPLDLAMTLVDHWAEYTRETKVLAYLYTLGLSKYVALKIYKFYGLETKKKLTEDPYRLLAFLSWHITDEIARRMFSVQVSDTRRLAASVEAIVYEQYDHQRHTAVLPDDLVNQVSKLLTANQEIAEIAIAEAARKQLIVLLENRIQGSGQFALENYIAQKFVALVDDVSQLPKQSSLRDSDKHNDYQLYSSEILKDLRLSEKQHLAIETALLHRVSIIVGGTGTGKSTVLKAICSEIEFNNGNVYLIALNNRAAMRMRESTGREAVTIAKYIHSLNDVPLPTGAWIIVNEASMLDVISMYRILMTLPENGRLVLVGDHHQLPPVGAGLILHILLELNIFPLVELSEIHRQTKETGISQVSINIRNQTMPIIKPYNPSKLTENGLIFIPSKSSEIVKYCVGLYHQLRQTNYDEVQILAPTNQLCNNINVMLHKHYYQDQNGSSKSCIKLSTHNISIAQGDPILITKNNYTKNLMTGDIGIVSKIYGIPKVVTNSIGIEEQCYVQVCFDERLVELTKEDLDHINLAYCITVHKSQGGQFSIVIIAVTPNKVADNTWYYTAVTQAQHQVFAVGDKMEFEKVITTAPHSTERVTGLNQAFERAINGAL